MHFVKGLTLLASGDEVSAQRSYGMGLDIVKKLAQPNRKPYLDDAIEDLDALGQQKPALRVAADNLIQTLRAAQ